MEISTSSTLVNAVAVPVQEAQPTVQQRLRQEQAGQSPLPPQPGPADSEQQEQVLYGELLRARRSADPNILKGNYAEAFSQSGYGGQDNPTPDTSQQKSPYIQRSPALALSAYEEQEQQGVSQSASAANYIDIYV